MMENREYFILEKLENGIYGKGIYGKDKYELMERVERKEGVRWFIARFRDGRYWGREEV
jgi:hypothetical protein